MGQQFLFKIILAGDGAVGKTSIRERYMGKGFTGNYIKTIGADFASKQLTIQDHKVTFQVFDLAGQDQYVSARAAFYKGGQAAFLVFDLQDEDTLIHLKQWVEDCVKYSEGSISTFFILGNKADLVETRQVSREAAIEFCQRLSTETGMPYVYLETSAKTGMNIKEAFDYMAYKLLERYNVDVDESLFEIPEGLTIIRPGEGAKAAEEPVAKVSEELMKQYDGKIASLEKQVEELQATVKDLDDRLVKLGQIVKKIIDSLEVE